MTRKAVEAFRSWSSLVESEASQAPGLSSNGYRPNEAIDNPRHKSTVSGACPRHFPRISSERRTTSWLLGRNNSISANFPKSRYRSSRRLPCETDGMRHGPYVIRTSHTTGFPWRSNHRGEDSCLKHRIERFCRGRRHLSASYARRS